MRILVAALLMTLMLPGPGRAQETKERKDLLEAQYEREQRARDAVGKDYDNAMKRTRSHVPPPQKNDPWATVRPASEPNPRR